MQRLDKVLVEQSLAATRTQAQKLIEAGLVELMTAGQWRVQNKASLKLPVDSVLKVGEHPDMRYVSRAGLKLEGALALSGIDVVGMAAIDIGQSTGGFTDCLLKHGAAQVTGIEVGRDQLVASLKVDERVVCLEGVNARHLTTDVLRYAPAGFDIAVMDVSFISQTLILPNIAQLLTPNGYLITLIKPQFELGPEALGKGGLVQDTRLYKGLEEKFKTLLNTLGFTVLFYTPSAIKGGDGNKEFLAVCKLL
ncbi:TlyA family RNA methyltransferase [Marinagarivorans algicola]|uniref:TlyA family RNA methyltransferase n=1 Tax=Marinagarivorans algicola TaxID=1513270 RepID=UPI0006B9CED5|nr:TlyA family RNA methyltransferase [Marinagarivorans algicola]